MQDETVTVQTEDDENVVDFHGADLHLEDDDEEVTQEINQDSTTEHIPNQEQEAGVSQTLTDNP